MRNPNRINKTIDNLKAIWILFPDMRLGQLISCLAAKSGSDIFNMEEDDLHEGMLRFLDDNLEFADTDFDSAQKTSLIVDNNPPEV